MNYISCEFDELTPKQKNEVDFILDSLPSEPRKFDRSSTSSYELQIQKSKLADARHSSNESDKALMATDEHDFQLKEGQISSESPTKNVNYGQRGLLNSKRRVGVVELHRFRLRLENLGKVSDSMKQVSAKNKCKEEIYKSKLLHWVMIGVVKHNLEPRKLQQVVD